LFTYSFERLDVWQLSKDFAKKVYQITADFPESERFGIVSQLRRAAISIVSNLAEGCSRSSQKEQARFYEYAYGSSIEIIAQLIISYELDYIASGDYENIRKEGETITYMINKLKRSRTAGT